MKPTAYVGARQIAEPAVLDCFQMSWANTQGKGDLIDIPAEGFPCFSQVQADVIKGRPAPMPMRSLPDERSRRTTRNVSGLRRTIKRPDTGINDSLGAASRHAIAATASR